MVSAPAAPQIVVPRLRGVSHGVAAVLALAAATVVVELAPNGRATIAVVVYGVGLVALFTGSAVYHRWPGHSRFKPLLQRIDHGTIYVFIAASYTPILVIALHGTLAWTMLAIMWAGAAAGVTFAIGWIHAPAPVVAASYLALGWVVVVTAPQLVHALPAAPLALLGAGGLLYSLGAVIYTTQRPDPWPRTFGFHEIFHALVIAAAAVQYIAIIGWVLPAA